METTIQGLGFRCPLRREDGSTSSLAVTVAVEGSRFRALGFRV